MVNYLRDEDPTVNLLRHFQALPVPPVNADLPERRERAARPESEDLRDNPDSLATEARPETLERRERRVCPAQPDPEGREARLESADLPDRPEPLEDQVQARITLVTA